MNVNYCVPILHISCKNIIDVDRENMIPQFHVGYMSMPFIFKQDIHITIWNYFSEKFNINTSWAMKKHKKGNSCVVAILMNY